MDIERLIKYFENQTSKTNPNKDPGFCSAIIHRGEIIHSINHGLASLEHDAPLTNNSVFYLASLSKQFTAACILKLVYDKKLKLTQDVRAIVKETDQFRNKITIQNLLNHTSGIPDYFPYLDCQLHLDGSDYFDNKHIMKIIDCLWGLDFAPNEKHEYSNSNYIILTEVVKKVTGKSFAKFAKDNLFKPVGMNQTSFDDDRFKVIKHRVSGYVSHSAKRKNYRVDLKNSCTVGDGGVLSSINDLAKWEANAHNNKLLDGPVLKGLTKTKALADGSKLFYANGMELSPENAPIPYVFHTGGFEGFHTLLIRVPSEKLSMLYLSNNPAVDFDLTTTRSKKFELIS